MRARWSLAALLLAATLTLIVLDRPLIRGDGVAYLAWTDTLVLDRDLDFNNQFERLRPVNTYQIQWNPTTERWVNIFPFGVAFFQAPFYAVGDALHRAGLLDINPDYFFQMQGVSYPYSLLLMIGANAAALAALALAWQVGRQFAPPGWAALLVYLLFVSTPLVFYSTVEPLNSHNPGALALGVFVLALVRTSASNSLSAESEGVSRSETEVRSPHVGWWIALGVSAGLAVLVRWQLAAVVVPAWAILALRRQWRGALISAVAAAITLLPLPLVWNALFGAPFVVPYDQVTGGQFIKPENEWYKVLDLLLRTSPALLLTLPGFVALWRDGRRELALFAAAAIVGQLVINGAALDWNAGYSFGVRRMSELFPVYALLACAGFGWLLRLAAGRRAWMWALRLIPIIGIVFAWAYLLAFLAYIWMHPASWLGDTSPGGALPFLLEQLRHPDALLAMYAAHVGPASWAMPGP